MEEFRKVMVNEGAQMTDEEIDEIIHEVDLDGDGQLNIDGNLLHNCKRCKLLCEIHIFL